MKLPEVPFEVQAVVYPDYVPGEYLVASQDSHCDFQKLIGQTRVELQSASTLFKRTDNTLPTRIVTAIQRPDYYSRLFLLSVHWCCSYKTTPKSSTGYDAYRTSFYYNRFYPEFYGDPLGSKITKMYNGW